MFDVYVHNKVDNLIIKLFNTRLLTLLGAILLPFLMISLNQISINTDPLILYLILSIGFLIGVFIFHKSVTNPVIAYLILQMMLFFIFFDKKILCHLGLNLKLYGFVFIIALSVAIYHLLKNFEYLWNNFTIFKYLFVYFIFIGIYLLFHYYSDFRLNNDLLSLRYAQSLKVGSLGNSQTSREFGDLSQYVLFIEWLIPIVSITVSLMLFKGFKTIKDINNRLINVIKLFSIILLTHFSFSIIAYALGFNEGMGIGAVNDVDSGYFIPLFLFILIGFKYYLANLPLNKRIKSISIMLNLIIAFIAILIIRTGFIAFGSSSLILGLLAGLPLVFFLNSYLGLTFPFFFTEKNNASQNQKVNKLPKPRLYPQKQPCKTILFASIIIIIIISYFISRMVNTFDSDLLSLDMRLDHWRNCINSWLSGLSIFKILFGYGLDTLRETLYFASNSSAIEKGIVSPHNLFILLIYEQGLVSFLYLMGIISTVKSSIKYIRDKNLSIYPKIFSTVNIAVVSAIFAMWCFVDMASISKIIFLSMLGFLEAIKSAYFKVNEKPV